MDNSDKLSTQERIKEAARRIFIKRGMAGTRMQEIADAAGINKAMLHYYFRSKEQLFQLIFAEALQKMFPHIESELSKEQPIREKLSAFIRAYIGQIRKHPFVPLFIIHELSKDRESLLQKIQKLQSQESGYSPHRVLDDLIRQLRKAQQRGELPAYPIEHLWINIIALCVFPFLARPILQHLMQMNDEQFERFLDQRMEMVNLFLDMAINKKNSDKS